MYKRKLKPFVMPVVYGLTIIAFFTSVVFLRKALDIPVFDDEDTDFIYVDKSILDNDIPVLGESNIIIRPYIDENVKIVKHFYDYKAEAERQEQAIIYYEKTYMQNSGVDYSNGESFEVLSVLDGTIVNVAEDNLLGKIIEVRHNNNLISIYQSLSETIVKKGDVIKKGQIIGKSGISNIVKELKNHLHFEILYKGQVVDPETFYDRNTKEL